MPTEKDPLMPQNDEESHAVPSMMRESSGHITPYPISMTSALWAEFLGTFVFVQIGCGINCSILYLGDNKAQGWAPSPLGWGLALLLAVYISAPISGGHCNPAVSFAFALVRPRKFSLGKLVPYWVVQLLGAMSATMSNLFLFHKAIGNWEGKKGIVRGTDPSTESAAAFVDYYNSFHEEHEPIKNSVHAFYVEFFGTAFLAFAIFAMTNPKNPIPGSMVPLIVAATYGSLVFALGALTGAPLNPARDFGARLVMLMTGWGTASFTHYGCYILGPLVGAPLGGWLADQVLYL